MNPFPFIMKKMAPVLHPKGIPFIRKIFFDKETLAAYDAQFKKPKTHKDEA